MRQFSKQPGLKILLGKITTLAAEGKKHAERGQYTSAAISYGDAGVLRDIHNAVLEDRWTAAYNFIQRNGPKIRKEIPGALLRHILANKG